MGHYCFAFLFAFFGTDNCFVFCSCALVLFSNFLSSCLSADPFRLAPGLDADGKLPASRDVGRSGDACAVLPLHLSDLTLDNRALLELQLVPDMPMNGDSAPV